MFSHIYCDAHTTSNVNTQAPQHPDNVAYINARPVGCDVEASLRATHTTPKPPNHPLYAAILRHARRMRLYIDTIYDRYIQIYCTRVYGCESKSNVICNLLDGIISEMHISHSVNPLLRVHFDVRTRYIYASFSMGGFESFFFSYIALHFRLDL